MNAAIFDLDGTLVDTYHAHFAAWRSIAAEIGHQLQEAEFAKQFGRTNPPIIRELYEWAGRAAPDPATIAEVASRKEADFRRIVQTDFPEMPGASHLVKSLVGAGWVVAAGTSAPRENALMFQTRLGCGPDFATMVTGDDVTHGKPDPEVFVLAATRLGVAPGRCVVIEDAGAGIEAARRGGMASVGLCSTGRTHDELSDADLVVDHLKELSTERLSSLLSSGST